MRAFIRIFVCVLFAAATAQAFAQTSVRERLPEDAIETSADRIVLPASPDGTLVITNCRQCGPKTLQATAATEYTIGKQKVTLQDFAAFVRSNPYAPIGVMYETSTKRVLRIQA